MRDRPLKIIAERGRMAWQKAAGYNWRALVEADISRFDDVSRQAAAQSHADADDRAGKSSGGGQAGGDHRRLRGRVREPAASAGRVCQPWSSAAPIQDVAALVAQLEVALAEAEAEARGAGADLPAILAGSKSQRRLAIRVGPVRPLCPRYLRLVRHHSGPSRYFSHLSPHFEESEGNAPTAGLRGGGHDGAATEARVCSQRILVSLPVNSHDAPCQFPQSLSVVVMERPWTTMVTRHMVRDSGSLLTSV